MAADLVLPCRSCGFCKESCPPNKPVEYITISCEKGIEFGDKILSYAMYGVENEESGKQTCPSYVHVGFDW